MKYFFLTMFFVISLSSSQAQDRNTEAKAAYLLAEEEFEASRYASAISYLNQATEKLGAANAKILYLKVLSVRMLARRDWLQLPALIETIDAFEKAPDYSSFNEEKKVEISQIKLKAEQVTRNMADRKLEILALTNMKLAGLRLGMTLDDITSVEPSFKPGNPITQDSYYAAFRGSIVRIYMKGGRITRIDSWPADQIGTDEIKNNVIVNKIKTTLGGNPVDTTVTKTIGDKKYNNTTKTRTITWSENTTVIFVQQTDTHSQLKKQTSKSSFITVTVMEGENNNGRP